MRIHENGGTTGYRSDSKCAYCRQAGHNQYNCPKVISDWEFWKEHRIPTNPDGSVARTGWYGGYPDTWGKWYIHCRDTYAIIQKRKKSTTTTRRTSSPRSCGFCGGKDHTRRNCKKMESFLKDCNTANHNWRKAAYKEIVLDKGISVGTAVIIDHSTGGWHDKETKSKHGIITSINWDTLNVFTALDKKSDAAHSPITIKVLTNEGETLVVNKGLDKMMNCIGETSVGRRSWYDDIQIVAVVAPAKQPLGEEWITGYKESFKTLVKKRSYKELESGRASEWSAPDLVAHINRWK